MITVLLVLGLVALTITIAHAVERAPLWPAVLVLAVCELVRALPLGR